MELKGGKGKSVKLSWLGHAMFYIEAVDGTKIVTDPYSEKTGYSFPEVSADVVTISHRHYDHDNVGNVKGSPRVIGRPGKYVIGSTIIEGISSYHDEVMGEKRGENTIFVFNLGEISIGHMGDYGQAMTDEHVNALKDIDVLLIPVGGTFTIDFKQAAEIVQSVRPKVVIPMHYKTEDCVINIGPVEPFLQEVPYTKRQKEETVQLSPAELPEETEVWVMRYIQ